MKRLTRAGLVLAVSGGLLALLPSLADVYVLPKLFILAAGGALAWLGLAGSRLRRTALDRPLAALWLCLLVSTIFSVDRVNSVLGAYPQAFYGLLPLALCTALYYATALSEAAESAVSPAVVWSSIALGAYALVQHVAGDPITHFALPQGRATSAIGSPVMLGACLALLLPIAVQRAVDERDAAARAAVLLVADALILSGSRGAILAAAVGVALYFFFTGRISARAAKAAAFAASAAVLAASLATGERRRGDSLRLELWRSGAAAFAARPVFGWGPDNFELALRAHKTDGFLRASRDTSLLQQSAHDDFLQAAVTLGLAGLGAYLWLLWVLAGILRRRVLAGDRRAAGIAAGLAALFVAAKLNPVPLSALAAAAALAALVCGGAALERRRAAGVAGPAALLCALCALAVWRGACADAAFRRGRAELASAPVASPAFVDGVNALRRANELAPWSLDYAAARCDTIFQLSALVPPPKAREFLEKALSVARDQIARHPNAPAAYELAGTALMLESKAGADTLRQAQAEMRRSSELDPTFMFTLQRRIELARALDDQPELARSEASYQRVVALTGADPRWTPLLASPARR